MMVQWKESLRCGVTSETIETKRYEAGRRRAGNSGSSWIPNTANAQSTSANADA